MGLRKYYKYYKENGLCVDCIQPKEENRLKFIHCQKCSNRIKEQSKKRKLKGLCVKCNNKVVENKSLCQECSKLSNDRTTKKRKNDKEIVFKYYGNKCVCCQESRIEFLTIDHVNNDGAEDRRKNKHKAICHHIIKQNFPDKYQILCWNCNAAKQYYGVCPHKET